MDQEAAVQGGRVAMSKISIGCIFKSDFGSLALSIRTVKSRRSIALTTCSRFNPLIDVDLLAFTGKGIDNRQRLGPPPVQQGI